MLDLNKSEHRVDIDILRGIAVLLVCLFHFWPNIITGGYIGVDIFFVISGYLITNIIKNKLSKNNFSFSDFYIRRVRRLFPSLIFVLTVVLITSYFFILYDDFSDLIKHSFFATIFASNILSWHDINYFNSTAELKPNLHLWSLGIEEQFYLLWPFLLYVFYRFRINLIYLCLIFAVSSFVLNIYISKTSLTASFYLPFTRYWEFLIGSFVAIIYDKYHDNLPKKITQLLFFFGFLLILYSTIFFNKNTDFPGFNAFYPCLGSALIILYGVNNKFFSIIKLQPILVFFGKISYALYLIHWPLICLNNLAFNISFFSPGNIFLFSILLAYLITLYVEKPFLTKYANIFGFRILLLTYILLTIFISYLFFYNPIKSNSRKLDNKNIINSSFLHKYNSYSDKVNVEYSEGCNFRNKDQTLKKSISDSCYIEKNIHKPTILLWGDSHMQALSFGIKNIYGNDYNILQVATHSSMPTLNVRQDIVSVASNNFAIDIIKKNKPEIVIIAQNNDHIKNDWALIAKKLKEIGIKRIMLIGPTPKWYPSLPRVLIKEGDTRATSLDIKHGFDKSILNDDKLLENICYESGIEYISILKFVKKDNNILVREPITNELLVFDYGHLTLPASEWLANNLFNKYIK